MWLGKRKFGALCWNCYLRDPITDKREKMDGWMDGRSPYSLSLSDGDGPEGEMQAELSGQNWQVQRKLFQ